LAVNGIADEWLRAPLLGWRHQIVSSRARDNEMKQSDTTTESRIRDGRMAFLLWRRKMAAA
jgi:hypothetical protein